MRPTPGKIVSQLLILLAALPFLGSGCTSTPRAPTRGKPVAWDIEIKKVTPSSIDLDVIGLSPSDDTDWRRGIKPSEYWEPGSSLRRTFAARSKTTGFKQSDVFKLSKDDPIWNDWFRYGSFELVITANLPERYSDDESDLHRKFVLLGKKEWREKTIRIEVSDHQIRVLTPPRP